MASFVESSSANYDDGLYLEVDCEGSSVQIRCWHHFALLSEQFSPDHPFQLPSLQKGEVSW